MAAAASVVLLAWVATQILPNARPPAIRVSRVTGSTQFLGSRGGVDQTLKAGDELRAGDTLETRSTDAWVELELEDGSRMTVAGHSALRVLNDPAGMTRLKLLNGSLWVSPGPPSSNARALVVQTPSAVLEAGKAQFDLHACSTETTVRVNEGSARLKQSVDGSEVSVAMGNQVTASLSRPEPLNAEPQPRPINAWSCDLGQVPEITLGRWLPPGRNCLALSPTRRPGFHAGRVVVVIGILAILASLLLPALAAAKEKAKVAKCGNQLRQIQLALQMYADDHGDLTPPRNYGFGASWIHRLQPGFVNQQILRCPADMGVVTNSSYLMNGFIDAFLVRSFNGDWNQFFGAYKSGGFPGLKLGEIGLPSETVTFGEKGDQVANEYLEAVCLPEHNRRFTVKALSAADVHRGKPRELERILSWAEKAASATGSDSGMGGGGGFKSTGSTRA